MKLLQGNCLDKMKELEDNSIDTIITDPPYGLSFMGKKWDYDVPNIEIWKEALRVLKPGGTALIFAGSRTQHRMAVNVEDAGFILKDCIMWLYGSGFPKATDISKQLDKGHERKIIGYDKTSAPDLRDVGAMSKENTGIDKLSFGQNHRPAERKQVEITEATTPEAKLWNGWKSHGLKPAYEPILVAVKPNDGTYANNALKWGVSGLNIDGGRIDNSEYTGSNNGNNSPTGNFGVKDIKMVDDSALKGRFPANIILDEEAGRLLDEQSGELSSGSGNKNKNPKKLFGTTFNSGDKKNWKASKGGASRFFYCAKASKSERNAGCEDMELTRHSDRNKEDGVGGDNPRNRTNTLKKNFHPTVKPLKLMEYLCTLTKTPTDGLVLDPFMGSGTTGVACINTNRDFIGIELDPEYIKIAEARINNIRQEHLI